MAKTLHPMLAVAQQAGRSTLCCTASDNPDFGQYLTTGNVVEHHYWNPAFHLEGDAVLECEQAPGLYLAGDHNVCDFGDAYITCIHATNRILDKPSAT